MKSVQFRFRTACLCAAFGAAAGAATTCVMGGWPVADTSVRAAVGAAPAAGGASVSDGTTIETRFRTVDSADDFALDTRPTRAVCILIR